MRWHARRLLRTALGADAWALMSENKCTEDEYAEANACNLSIDLSACRPPCYLHNT